MEQEQNKLYGNLFGSINLNSEEHLEVILQSMNHEQSLYFLVESIKAAHKRGAFTIGETEVISKAIRVINHNNF